MIGTSNLNSPLIIILDTYENLSIIIITIIIIKLYTVINREYSLLSGLIYKTSFALLKIFRQLIITKTAAARAISHHK